MTQFSFAVTAYNEMSDSGGHGSRILKAIETALSHDAVTEIVIVDDGSEDFNTLVPIVDSLPKVKLYQNPINLGVFGNKLAAIEWCTNDWVITCDSDNFMAPDFIDRLLHVGLDPNVWYCPSFARPEFDYRELAGVYDLTGAGELIDRPMAGCLMNTGNQTVHRPTFMKVFEKYRGHRADLKMPNWLNLTPEVRNEHYWRLVFDANDSFIFNMEWLSADYYLAVLPGLEYDHFYSGGEASNYARAPQEKEQLNTILVNELKDRSQARQRTRAVSTRQQTIEHLTQATIEDITDLASEALSTNRTTEGVGASSPVMFTFNGLPPAEEPKTVLVIGAPRGGTSAVAAVLDGLGVYMGEPADMASGGSFENHVFVRGSITDQIAEVDRLNREHDLWGFKNPYGQYVLDNLPPCNLRNPCCIFVFRDLVALAMSRFHNVHPRTVKASLERAANLLVQLQVAMAEMEWPSMIVSYEMMKSTPVAFVESVMRFLSLEPSAATLCQAIGRINTHGGYLEFQKEPGNTG